MVVGFNERFIVAARRRSSMRAAARLSILGFVFVAMCLLFAGTALAQSGASRPSADTALQVASLWVQSIDRNDTKGSYVAAGDLLKRNTTAQKWDNYLRDIRTKRGAVSVREWARVDRNVNPQDLPPGEYLTVYFLVNTSKTYGGADQVSLAYINGRWVPIGFVVLR